MVRAKGPETEVISIRPTKALLAEIERAAETEGASRHEWILGAITDRLRERNPVDVLRMRIAEADRERAELVRQLNAALKLAEKSAKAAR